MNEELQRVIQCLIDSKDTLVCDYICGTKACTLNCPNEPNVTCYTKYLDYRKTERMRENYKSYYERNK